MHSIYAYYSSLTFHFHECNLCKYTVTFFKHMQLFNAICYIFSLCHGHPGVMSMVIIASYSITILIIFTYPRIILGRKNIYLISFAISIVGNICCAVSVNIAMLIVFRGVSAVGTCSVSIKFCSKCKFDMK